MAFDPPDILSSPQAPRKRSGDLFARTLRSSGWAVAGSQAVTVLSLVTSIFVARAVSPSELGRYALVAAISSTVGSASSLQAGGYYIVSDDPSRRLLRTGLTLELAISTILWLLTGVACVVVALATDDWGFPALLFVGSATLVCGPFSSIRAWFERRLQYRIPTFALAGSAVLSSVTKIVLTASGLGAWGLVIGDLVLAGVYGLAMLLTIPDARGFAFDRALARKQLSFGLPLMANNVLNTAASRVPDLTIGAFLGTQDLGYYFLASRIPAQIYQFGCSLAAVLFPAFSRSTPGQLHRGMTAAMRFSAMLTFIPLVIAIPLAKPIVTAVWGSVWAPAAIPFTVLLAWMSVRLILWHTGNLLKSQNRQRELVRLGVWQIALTPPCVVAGTAAWGLYGAVGGMLAVELLLAPMHVRLIRSIVVVGAWEGIGPPSVAAAVSLAVSIAAAMLLPDAIAIAIAIVATLLIFAWVAWLTDRTLMIRMKQAFRKQPRAAAT